MTDLIDRLAGDVQNEKIPIHQFLGHLRLYSLGIPDITSSFIATEYDISLPDEISQALAMATAIDDASTAVEKIALVLRFEAVMFNLETAAVNSRYRAADGTLNKSVIKADAGFD